MGVEVFVKRYVDESLVYSGKLIMSLTRKDIKQFLLPEKAIIGNIYSSNFFGKLNRLRLYSKPIKEERFENHIKFNQSYDISDPFELDQVLLFKANFDFPYSLVPSEERDYGVIENSSLRADVSKFVYAYNFDSTEYPYNFNGENQRQIAQLPSYGSQVFNNNKIRLETLELTNAVICFKKKHTKKWRFIYNRYK